MNFGYLIKQDCGNISIIKEGVDAGIILKIESSGDNS